MSEHRFCPACGADISRVEVKAGDPYVEMVVAERYRIESLIGEGAMGRVYKAEQTALGKRFAIKILHPHLTHDPDSHARFANEAHNAASLNHPNVVSVVDYGRTKDGVTYIVMEHVEGRTLEDIITEEFPLGRDRIIDYSLQILAALAEAHGLGILHRDLKPENILVQQLRTHGELLKVLDFGIAKLMDSAPNAPKVGVTSQGVVCGTPEYMSPEQARGFKLDGRSDLYAVGVVLYQMLTGRLPFESEAAVELLHRHIHEAPVPPSQVLGHPPDALEAVIMRALSKDRAARFASAQEFRDALVAVANEAAPDPGLRCAECGAKMAREDKFCAACGTPSPHQETKTPTRRRGTRLSNQRLRAQLGEATAEMVVRAFPLPLAGSTLLEKARAGLAKPVPGMHAQVIGGTRGAGKTRLLEEIAATAELQGWQVFGTGAEPSGAAPSLWPIRQIVGQVLRVDPKTVTTRDLGRAANLTGLTFEALPGLTELFGLGGPASDAELAVRRRECWASVVQTLTHAGAGAKPTLLLFDDVDRYDSSSRRAVQRLARAQSPYPIIVLISSAESDLAWLRSPVETLAPLDGPTVRDLVSKVIGDVKASSKLPDELAEHAPMTPLRLELLLRAIAAQQPVSKDDSDADLVNRRLAVLDDGDRRVLEVAAILGHSVSERDLNAIMGRQPNPPGGWELEESLSKLHMFGLLEQDDPGERVFGGRLIRDVVLAGMPDARRRELHAVAAEVAEASEHSVTVRAMHLLRAGSDGVTETLAQAAEAAIRSFDDRKAVTLLRAGLRAASTLPPGPREAAEAALTTQLVEPLSFSNGQREAIEVARTQVEKMRSLNPDLQRAYGRALSRGGRHQDAVDALQRALGGVIAEGDREKILSAYAQLALALADTGDMDRALREISEGLDMCTLGEGPRAQVDFPMWRYLLTIAGLKRRAGDLRGARTWTEHALWQAEQRGDPLGLLRSHTDMAWVLRDSRQGTLAEQHLARALEQARHFGDRLTTAEILLERARFRAGTGQLEDAQRCLDEALRLAQVIEWKDGAAQAEQALKALADQR